MEVVVVLLDLTVVVVLLDQAMVVVLLLAVVVGNGSVGTAMVTKYPQISV